MTDRKNFSARERTAATLAMALLAIASFAATSQDVAFQLDPERSNVSFTLGDVLHTVHGTFRMKPGTLHLDPASGRLAGAIVVDSNSGNSGSGMRDRKMDKEVLESERYPEIVFRPDHVQGAVAMPGKSSVMVHGVFSIHGTDHEMTLPADVETTADHWSATMHFIVPYAKWGMKNPSTMFLRVSESVNIDMTAAGVLGRP